MENSGDHSQTTYQLMVVADADPDILAKVASAVLITNRLPSVATMMQRREGIAEIAIEMTHSNAELAARVARLLSRATCIRDISLFECNENGSERITLF